MHPVAAFNSAYAASTRNEFCRLGALKDADTTIGGHAGRKRSTPIALSYLPQGTKRDQRPDSKAINSLLTPSSKLRFEIQVLAAGYDPTIGFLHAGRRGGPDFVLDLMEPLRPLVDRKALEFVGAHVLSRGFHDTIRRGVQAYPGNGEASDQGGNKI